MQERENISGKRARWELLTIVVFLVLLCLPTMDYFLHLDRSQPPDENRMPAGWPTYQGAAQGQKFIAGLESYFNDHFGFRKKLIRWSHRWRGKLFGHDASVSEVLAGRDGWLFFLENQMIEHTRRSVSFSHQDLENWRRLLETRRDWITARGGKYIFVVPPDKQSVYPEYLPDWLQPGTKPSKIAQLVQYMKSCSTVQVLDLTDALRQAKKTRVTYLTTDTHWNQYGAYVGYQETIKALAQQMPGLVPPSADSRQWRLISSHPKGDLAVMMGASDTLTEPTAFTRVPIASDPKLDAIYDTVRLPQRRKNEYPAFLTLNNESRGKVVLFRDSFAGFWRPYMGQNFREVIYLWYHDWNRPLLAREKPDVVIDEMVERDFNVEDPVDLLRKDKLSESEVIVANGRANAGVKSPADPVAIGEDGRQIQNDTKAK